MTPEDAEVRLRKAETGVTILTWVVGYLLRGLSPEELANARGALELLGSGFADKAIDTGNARGGRSAEAAVEVIGALLAATHRDPITDLGKSQDGGAMPAG